MNKRAHFDNRAKDYDSEEFRLRYIDEMAQSILDRVPLTKEMTIVDFGAGTGLLTERIAPHVGKIIAIDVSAAMIAKLEEKRDTLPCELELLQMDLCTEGYATERADGLISSMTLHHIEDVPALLKKIRTLLKPGAFIALCDIDTEDGSFHTVDSGVRHHGFDREEICRWCEEAGFMDVEIGDSALIVKPHGEYGAFLLTAKVPG
ncbi:class I SAM-dependent DNA methyltransferase [Nitratifractor sp.]